MSVKKFSYLGQFIQGLRTPEAKGTKMLRINKGGQNERNLTDIFFFSSLMIMAYLLLRGVLDGL